MTGFKVSDYAATFTGKRINLDDPKPEDISLVDIAIGLSQQCRYSGQTWPFYSISEHSLNVAQLCRKDVLSSNPSVLNRVSVLALMHDAPEFIINDMIRPVKRRVNGYDALESRIMHAITQRFGLIYLDEDWKMIKRHDDLITIVEREQLMPALDRGEYGQGVDVNLLPKVRLGAYTDPPAVAAAFINAFCFWAGNPMTEEERQFAKKIGAGYRGGY